MSDSAHIAIALRKWAVKEMKFRSTDQEPNDHGSKINLSGICLGPLVDVWSYVEKHVRSETTVQKVQGNLKLHAQAENKDDRNLQLRKEREKLLIEVAELEKSTRILHESVQETSLTICEKEKVLHLMTRTNQDHKRTAQLLKKNRNQVHERTKDLNKSVQDLENCLRALVPDNKGKEADLHKFKIDLEKMCQSMQDSLNELINQDPNMEAIHGSKLEIGKTLAVMLEQLPHPLFMRLIQEQQEGQVSLKKALESSVPFPQANEILNFSPADVQPLQKLLYNLSWFHTESCSRASRAKSSTQLLNKEMASLRSELNQLLDDIFSADDKTKLSAQQLIDLEIQATSRKVAVDSLQRNLDELETFCLRSEANQVEIERKIATIERNSCTADHLSLLICTLARKHANNPRLLQQSVARLQRLASEDLKASYSALASHVEISQLHTGKELDLYKQLKPFQLLSLPIERKWIPIHRLTIHRFLPLTNGSSQADENVSTTLKHLGLHRFQPVLDVFQSVGRVKGQNERMRRVIRWHETRQQEITEKYGLSWLQHGNAHYKELAKELNDKRHKQEADLLTSLETRTKKMDDVGQIFADIQTSLTEWCEEPAKLIDTGRLVGNETLEHYRQQWSKSLTMCRKKN